MSRMESRGWMKENQSINITDVSASRGNVRTQDPLAAVYYQVISKVRDSSLFEIDCKIDCKIDCNAVLEISCCRMKLCRY